VLGAATDAELGFFIIRGKAEVPEVKQDQPAEASGEQPSGPTLLRALLIERHWQMYRTFRALFLREARELADREQDPTVSLLDVSERQFHRWLHGARPRPDACRVLESMFGHPIGRLLGPADQHSAGVQVAAAVAGVHEAPPGSVVPDAGAATAVQVSVEPGTAVTVVCPDDGSGRVAVLAGGVRILIDAPGTAPAAVVPAAPDVPVADGGARVYSLAARRAR
jgi:hypothetical protein